MKKIVFFNNKGGVGKTTLVYHFSYMLSELGHKVLCVDLDPQSNLTSMFLSESRMEEVFNDDRKETIAHSLTPLKKGIGDFTPAHIEMINENIGLLIGDLSLSTFEDELSESWGKCLNGKEGAFRIVSAFNRIIEEAGNRFQAEYAVIDVGPNLGAINRSTIISSDYVALPVAADLFSLQGIKNLGTALHDWRGQWAERLLKNPEPLLNLPDGNIKPIGYVVLQHGSRANRIYKSYERWANKIPKAYSQYVLRQSTSDHITDVKSDQNCIGLLKHYHSLMPMAMEARKPVFLLKPSDGAIGAHFQAIKEVYRNFKELTQSILDRCE